VNQPLILTCDCGYRTPEVGRNGQPLSDARAKYAFGMHTCTPILRRTQRITVPCADCGTLRTIRKDSTWKERTGRCRSCGQAARAQRTRADIDEMAVARLIAGSPVRSTPAERLQAVAQLSRRRLSCRQISERMGVSRRTVVRLRARARAAA
jgi:hypothetical protein